MIREYFDHCFLLRIDESKFWPAFWISAAFECLQAIFAALAITCEYGFQFQSVCRQNVPSNSFVTFVLIIVLIEASLQLLGCVWSSFLRNARDGNNVFLRNEAFDGAFRLHRWIPVDTMFRPGVETKQFYSIWPPDAQISVLSAPRAK